MRKHPFDVIDAKDHMNGWELNGKEWNKRYSKKYRANIRPIHHPTGTRFVRTIYENDTEIMLVFERDFQKAVRSADEAVRTLRKNKHK